MSEDNDELSKLERELQESLNEIRRKQEELRLKKEALEAKKREEEEVKRQELYKKQQEWIERKNNAHTIIIAQQIVDFNKVLFTVMTEPVEDVNGIKDDDWYEIRTDVARWL